MTDDVRPGERHAAHRFGEKPVETDHDPQGDHGRVPDPETGVARGEPERFLIKQMTFTVDTEKALGPDHDRRVV